MEGGDRAKIIADIIKRYSGAWLSYITDELLKGKPDSTTNWKEFTSHYQETRYEKGLLKIIPHHCNRSSGVVGGMKELAWRASDAKGLTSRVLSEIVRVAINTEFH